jgi:hypothetical protein
MVITPENKLEIVDYLSGLTRYQETFEEVYDHIISALEEVDNQVFNMGLVAEIVAADYGGFQQIKANEVEFEHVFVRSCMRDMIDVGAGSFRFPMLLFNVFLLVFCVIVNQFSLYYPGGINAFVEGMLISIVILCMSYLSFRYLYKRKQKPSVKFKFMERAVCVASGMSLNLITLFLSKRPLFDVSAAAKNLIAFALFLTLCNFLFAYHKVYYRLFYPEARIYLY